MKKKFRLTDKRLLRRDSKHDQIRPTYERLEARNLLATNPPTVVIPADFSIDEESLIFFSFRIFFNETEDY